MSEIKKTPVKIGGKNGVIIHDSLCADGPVDAITGEPLIDPETGKPYPGKNDDMANLLHDYLRLIRGTVNLKDEIYAPRYGVLSLLAMSTPIYVYDHPAFKKVAKTAFTDGQNCFIDADFMRKMVQQEKESGGKKHGVTWVIVHELLHKLLYHTVRLKKFPPDIANIAEDLVINGKIKKSYPELKPIPLLEEIGQGMKPEDADKYHSMSEEIVAEMLWRAEEQKKKKKEKKKEKDKKKDKGEDQQKQKSQGGSGDEEGEGQESSDDNENGEPSNGNQKGKKSKPSKKPKGEKGEGESGSDQDDEENEDTDENNQGQDNDADGEDEENNKGGKKKKDDSEEDENDEGGQNQNGRGQGDDDSDSEGKGSGEGDEEDEDEDDEENEYGNIHHITPEELAEIIKENGLQDTVGQALGMPDPSDEEGIAAMKEKNKMKIVDAVQTAVAEAANAEGLYPGNHIEDYAASLIGNLDRGKLDYKFIIRKHFQGEGGKLYYADDEAGLPWLLDKNTMGVDPFYIGSLIPQQPDESVYVLIDTSGSTSGGTLRKEFLENALNIKRSLSTSGDNARKVFIQSADTVLRGEPIMITDANINTIRHDGIPVFGDGGTSFKEVLKEGLAQPLLAKENIKSVIYFTDCIDAVPQRKDFEEFINKGIKIVFITTPGFFNEKWNQQVTWAEVYCIEEGTVVDMTKSEEQQVRNTRKAKQKI